MKLRIAILLIGLIISFSCKTMNEVVFRVPLPTKPSYEKVVFIEKDDGLFLSYSEYRKLERNIIEMRIYIEKLEGMIEIYSNEESYKEEKSGK